jgi:hypothetical protein
LNILKPGITKIHGLGKIQLKRRYLLVVTKLDDISVFNIQNQHKALS